MRHDLIKITSWHRPFKNNLRLSNHSDYKRRWWKSCTKLYRAKSNNTWFRNRSPLWPGQLILEMALEAPWIFLHRPRSSCSRAVTAYAGFPMSAIAAKSQNFTFYVVWWSNCYLWKWLKYTRWHFWRTDANVAWLVSLSPGSRVRGRGICLTLARPGLRRIQPSWGFSKIA